MRERGSPKNKFFAYSCSVQYHNNLVQHRLEILFLLDTFFSGGNHQAFAVTKLNPFEGVIESRVMTYGRMSRIALFR